MLTDDVILFKEVSYGNVTRRMFLNKKDYTDPGTSSQYKFKTANCLV